MLIAIASAMSVGLRRLKTSALRLAGSTIRAEAAIESIGVRPGRDVDHRERVRRDRRADDDVDLVLAQQLARVGHRLGRVRAVVEHDPVDLLAGDRRRQELERVLLRDAERCGRPGRGQRHADVDVRDRRRRERDGYDDGERRRKLACHHEFLRRSSDGIVRRILASCREAVKSASRRLYLGAHIATAFGP
jgi:hypothetical protein